MKPSRRVAYGQTSADPRSDAVTLRLECGHQKVLPTGGKYLRENGELNVPKDAVETCRACPDINTYDMFADVRERLGTGE